jgi:hypothetical protein
VVVDRDEEGAHVYPITYAELISENFFSCLDGRQNWDSLDTQSSVQLEV